MTETDWFRCDDVNRMHRFVARRASRRKLDLFLCAVFHQITLRVPACGHLPGQRGRCSDLKPQNLSLQEPTGHDALAVARDLLLMFWPAGQPVPEEEVLRLKVALPRLVRCIFGNPFRPVKLATRCVTPTVRALAEAAYDAHEERVAELDESMLAILADACEEAGLPAELLEHLRGLGPHARGCHAVDALLGLG